MGRALQSASNSEVSCGRFVLAWLQWHLSQTRHSRTIPSGGHGGIKQCFSGVNSEYESPTDLRSGVQLGALQWSMRWSTRL